MKTLIKQFIYSLFFIIPLQACIDPVSLELTKEDPVLVVDGMITNLQEPYTVKLSYISSLESRITDKVINAKVVIKDNFGAFEELYEDEPGVYKTAYMQGIVGREYSVHIKLKNGEEYESLPEKLTPVAEILNFDYEYETWNERVGNITDTEALRDGFQFYVKIAKPEKPGNFYRWKSSGIKELFTTPPPGPPPGCCAICYLEVNSLSNSIVVDTDNRLGFLEKIPVLKLPNDGASRILVDITQYSLTERAFNFWDQVDKQYKIVGSIFDPTPFDIKGNIINLNGPEKTVYGYFGASSVSQKSMMLYRSRYISPNQVRHDGDCRLLFPGSTIERPERFF